MKKETSIILIFFVLIMIPTIFFSCRSQTNWGITFSQKESLRLNGEWQNTYEAIIEELKPNKIRLVGYWDFIEKNKSIYDFSEMDSMVEKAREREIPIILAIGQKTPRWPECHVPPWAEDDPNKETYLLEYLRVFVDRYKNLPNLLYWQVENEPFLGKEKCSPSSETFFKKEIDLVKNLDPDHKIVLTDSGELGNWEETAKYADVFGYTLYHKVYDTRWGTFKVDRTKKYFTNKAKTIRESIHPNLEVICIEASMEPWGAVTNERLGSEQYEIFTVEDLRYNLDFAKKLRPQFNEVYLWGAEWWYYAKNNGHPEYWDEIKQLNKWSPL